MTSIEGLDLEKMPAQELADLVRRLANERDASDNLLKEQIAEFDHVLGLLRDVTRSDFNGGLEDTRKHIISDMLTRMNRHFALEGSAYLEHDEPQNSLIGTYEIGSRTNEELESARSAVASMSLDDLRERALDHVLPITDLKVRLDQPSRFRAIFDEKFSYLGQSVGYTDIDRGVMEALGQPFFGIALKAASLDGNGEQVIGVVYGHKRVSGNPIELTQEQLNSCNSIRYPAAALLYLISAIKKISENEKYVNLGLGASEIAHELRSPITTIGGLAFSLLDRVPKDILVTHNLERYLEIIKEVALGIEKLTDQVLDYARPIKTHPESFDIVEGVRCVAEKLKGKTTFTFNYSGPVKVYADRTQVGDRILTNIINNAYQAAEHEESCAGVIESMPNIVTINLGLTSEYADITIHNRQYMAPDLLKRIQDGHLFSTSKKKGSNGLGFATAVRYAKANNCQLAIGSSQEEGTLQRLRIPLYKG